MLVFPNAKINIGLNVIEKRPDGYHNIESCFYPVPWYDALEVLEADELTFTTTGIPIPGDDNICFEAYRLLEKEFKLPPVKIHLHKNIPIGAGLGGGSADGAFMLKLLNDKFSLNIGNDQLKEFASNLGSDCPFFIENRPAYIEEVGNLISPINLDLTGFHILIIYPNSHIETESAYNSITPKHPEKSLKHLLESMQPKDWGEHVKNDFEQNDTSGILKLKASLYSSGAIYASMTGSGSAVYGIFKEPPVQPSNYPSIVAKL